MQITFGNDIEMMLQDASNGNIVNAIPVLKRDKFNPIKLGNGVNLYFDNMLAEFTIKPYRNKEQMLF